VAKKKGKKKSSPTEVTEPVHPDTMRLWLMRHRKRFKSWEAAERALKRKFGQTAPGSEVREYYRGRKVSDWELRQFVFQHVDEKLSDKQVRQLLKREFNVEKSLDFVGRQRRLAALVTAFRGQA
jgi:hypothetical protein